MNHILHRSILTGCVALGTVGVLAAWMSSVQAAPNAAGDDGPLVVTSVTPSRNRSVLLDLSDPGVNNRITVRFSTRVNPSDLIDDQDPLNGLSDKCEIHDQMFTPVRCSASVFRNVLSIDPFSAARPLLPQGRYTLTLKSSIRSARGRRLNAGRADFTTSFNVGSDVYPPVLVRTSPVASKTGVGLRRTIVATFDEPIDRASASASVRLEDRSTSPPTPVPARVRLARHGFDVVVTPMSRSGYPSGTELTLVISGQGSSTDPSSTVLTDAVGNKFTRDAGPQWADDQAVPTLFHSGNGDFDDVTGQFTMTFRTRGVARAAR